MIDGTPEGTVIRQAPCLTIEALSATRLNIVFLVDTDYPCFSQNHASGALT